MATPMLADSELERDVFWGEGFRHAAFFTITYLQREERKMVSLVVVL